jgi:cob(I)alamin adenosyltransferase
MKPQKSSRTGPGKVHIYTGNGKGKTTAALGLALRAVGAGLRVCIIQFVKPRECSEHRAIARFLKEVITVRRFGRPGFVRKPPSRSHIIEAGKALRYSAIAMNSNRYDVVVLDEVCMALNLKMIDMNELMEILTNRPRTCEIILTGRNAPLRLIACADLVTEMGERKHYFNSGVKARRGIEF